MPFPARKKIGRYEICSQLGAGGRGEVYLANDTKLDRKVALKILPSSVVETDSITSSDRVRRFLQEAKAASALNHPNILTIYEVDELLYLKGRRHTESAIQMFENAAAIDPGFASSYAGPAKPSWRYGVSTINRGVTVK